MTNKPVFPFGRRAFIKSLLVAATLSLGLYGCGGSDNDDNSSAAQSKYYASWTGSLSNAAQPFPGAAAPAPQTFNNQTVRHVLRLSLGGDTLRIKVSNLFGTAPITFSGVRVAKSTGQSNIDVGTDRPVTFNNQASLTLPAGAEILSDAIALPTAPLSNIAVSMYFQTPTPVATVHALAREIAYLGAGNQLSAPSIPAAAADQRQAYYGLTAVETSSTEPTKVVVAFGDSITDGFNSTVGAAKRYPNQLDDRLKAAGFVRTGVVNAGISGNRWLNDVAGPNGNSRFDRDVINVLGVTHTIILLGINDIGFSAALAPQQAVSVAQITTSMTTAIAKAKARGIKVYLGTLLPFKGAAYYSEEGEAKRQAVNAFIRNNRDIDGVIDFDKVMQNPADPLTMNPTYDSGDHLHPNDVGYGAMATSINLANLQ
jgi:lysophospholipase L1-like esterase